MRRSRGEKRFGAFNYVILGLLVLVTLYPFWYVLIYSLNDGANSRMGGLWLWVRKFSLGSYKVIFSDMTIARALIVSVGKTVVGAVSSVLCISLYGYALTRKELIGRRFMIGMVTFTMYFSGGIIPYYLLMRDLHLLNNYLVYIIPSLLWAFLLIIVRTYFESNIPPSLEESAKLDGAGDLRIFFQIIFPISMPIIAVVALFTGVGQWNDWYSGYIFMTKQDLIPLQTILVKIINQATATDMISSQIGLNLTQTGPVGPTAESVRAATMIVAIVPIVMVYPFLQRYFVSGILVGSIKE